MRFCLYIVVFCFFFKLNAQDNNSKEKIKYFKKDNLSIGFYHRLGFLYSEHDGLFIFGYELLPYIDYQLFNNFSVGLGYRGIGHVFNHYPEYDIYSSDAVLSAKYQFLERRRITHSVQLLTYYGESRVYSNLEYFQHKQVPCTKIYLQYGLVLKPRKTPGISFSFLYGYGIHLLEEKHKYDNLRGMLFGVTYHIERNSRKE